MGEQKRIPAHSITYCPPSCVPGGKLRVEDYPFQVYTSPLLQQTEQQLLVQPVAHIIEQWKKTTHSWLLEQLRTAAAGAHGVCTLRKPFMLGGKFESFIELRAMVIACVLPLDLMPYTEQFLEDVVTLDMDVTLNFPFPGQPPVTPEPPLPAWGSCR